MYMKTPLDQQIEQVSTFHISSFETVSNLLFNCTHCNHQPLTLLTLRNGSLFIIRLHNCSPLINIIITNRRLIVLKLKYFSSFINNHLHIYHSPTNCEGRVDLDLTFYLVLILVWGYCKCITESLFQPMPMLSPSPVWYAVAISCFNVTWLKHRESG